MRAYTAVRGLTLAALVTFAAACAPDDEAAPPAEAAADTAAALVTEVFETPRDTIDNIDSPAVWHGPAGQHWLIATAKETDALVVSDATTGVVIRRVGTSGVAPGQMDRPNGIAVVDDLLFLVERDNHRVQVFTLPDFRAIGIYGADDLRKPYGIAIERAAAGSYTTWITDSYEYEEDVIPADSLLGERVRRYAVTVSGDRATATLEQTFGETQGEGRLRVVESIAVDTLNDILLIAEEEEGASMVKVYGTDGRYANRLIESRFFPYQAEGIVLYECGADGYWIATDQSEIVNTFHVFERRTLEHLGSFRGRTVLNTDGIALTQVPFGPFPSGAFYAVHNDGNVAAFSWADIANALGLRSDCTTGGAPAAAAPAGTAS